MSRKLSLVRPDKPKSPTSPVITAILSWLQHKAANTQRVYLGIGSDWSRHLGCADMQSRDAGRAWLEATHAEAQSYLLEVATRPAQAGRPSQDFDRVSDATLRHKAQALYAMYEELIAQGFVAANPFARVRREYKGSKTGDRRPHQLVDYDKVRELLNPPDFGSVATAPEFERARKEATRNHAIMCLLFGAGLRRSEVVKLRLSDICTTTSGTTYLRLRDTKAQETQEHALPDWIGSAIELAAKERKREGAKQDSPLFVCYYGHGIPDHHQMGDSTLYRIFKAKCNSVGLPEGITPHCARVTAITKLLDQGLSHRDVKEFSRHASVEMVERYDKKRKQLDQSVGKKLSY